jgi:hypothetical protein
MRMIKWIRRRIVIKIYKLKWDYLYWSRYNTYNELLFGSNYKKTYNYVRVNFMCALIEFKIEFLRAIRNAITRNERKSSK